MKRRQTSLWDKQDGDFGTLSFDKMKQVIDLNHPRKIVNGEPKKLSLCSSTGRLAESNDLINNFDELGIGISLYFKLLKSLIVFFIFCSILSSPLSYIYSTGSVAESQVGVKSILAAWTLGNLG